MQIADLALQRNKYKHLSDEEWQWFLQQEEGRLRTAEKLPSFAAVKDWWYPVRLSCEQCSSELTARYKSERVKGLKGERVKGLKGERGRFVDLTGGYGVDTLFLSDCFDQTDYVEQDAELCRLMEHNSALAAKTISVHHATAEEFLSSPLHSGSNGGFSLIYLDPARRDSHGGKVFRLEECTPNVVELAPALLEHLAPDGRILLKLSPMLDITQALKTLSVFHLQFSVHVVAVKNEVKELLFLSSPLNVPTNDNMANDQMVHCIDLSEPEKVFSFRRAEEEEEEAQSRMAEGSLSEGQYLYEPNAAVLKAGAYKLAGERFGLQKLAPNTHLYVSAEYVSEWPGRVWRIQSPITHHPLPVTQANVLVRNYPLTAEQLKKKLHLRDGGALFVIGCRVGSKPTVFLCERV